MKSGQCRVPQIPVQIPGVRGAALGVVSQGRNYFSHASKTGPGFCVFHKQPQAATPETGRSPVPATVRVSILRGGHRHRI